MLYKFPDEYYNERYLLIDKPTRNRETYYDEKGRLTEYINFCFYDYGKSVGEYIAMWDALLNYCIENGSSKPKRTTIIKAPQSKDGELTKETIFEMQNNLIPKLNIKKVYEYFKILTETTNTNDKFYLTPKKLLIFIKSTFIDLEPERQSFGCKIIKKDLRSVFRKFEEACFDLEKNKKNLKPKYFKILDNSFEGFTKTDFDKWHETNNNIPTIKIEKSK